MVRVRPSKSQLFQGCVVLSKTCELAQPCLQTPLKGPGEWGPALYLEGRYSKGWGQWQRKPSSWTPPVEII